MPDLEYTDFRPKWIARGAADDPLLDDAPAIGSPAEVSPAIHARLVPLDGSNTLSARTLADTVDLLQTLVQYAGHDVCHGVNPDFADLRSLSAEVAGLARLRVEPFLEGSFVIPARLPAAPLERVDEVGRPLAAATTEEVVRRFNAIFALVADQDSAAGISIGAIQAVESLGRVVRREAEAVEFTTFDALGRPGAAPARVDAEFFVRVQKVKASRQATRAKLDSLRGRLTAIDIDSGALQLNVDGVRRRVRGHFPDQLLPSVVEALGRRVQLQGRVEWRGRTPLAIQILAVELVSDDDR